MKKKPTLVIFCLVMKKYTYLIITKGLDFVQKFYFFNFCVIAKIQLWVSKGLRPFGGSRAAPLLPEAYFLVGEPERRRREFSPTRTVEPSWRMTATKRGMAPMRESMALTAMAAKAKNIFCLTMRWVFFA